MGKHKPSDMMIQDLDALLSKINAMEVVAKNDFERNSIRIMRALTEGQIHSVREFDHLKTAINLLTEQMFGIRDEIRD